MPLIILALAYVVASLVLAFCGRHRKFGFWGYFFCSLLFTPLLGLLFVIASAPRECPHCGPECSRSVRRA